MFRVPRMKKRTHGGPVDDASLSTKARWVGPGVVIAPDGANLWVSMLGELWKVAREQCRPATNDEKMGIEAVVQECQELIEELKRGSHRLGYKDLSQEEFPPEEGEGEEDREQQGRRDQHLRFDEAVEEVEYTPTQIEGEHEEDPEEAGQVKRRRSLNEPEQEEAPLSRANSEASRAEARHHPGFPGGVPETPPVNVDRPPIDPRSHEVQEALRQSELDANRLDGVPGPTSGPIYRWQQRARQDHIAPYFEDQEWFLAEAEEALEEESQTRQTKIRQLAKTRAEKDEWSLDWKVGTLTRHHRRKRKAKFDPKLNSDAPLPWTFLTERRETHVRKAHEWVMEEDDWQTPQRRSLDEWWKGKTVFYLKEIKEAKNYVAEKKGQDEVSLSKESPQDQEEWKISDLSEWNKVTQSGAVKVLGLEESRQIREELKQQGQEDRILPTKIARRYKPGEQPGEPAMKKSRLCIRGDLDPDILDLERFSPTLNTVNFNVLLQIAANENMKATVGDLKNAFCQSQPLHRPKGRLYFQQPKEGVSGLHPEQIVQIIAGCYGLVDAPLHWRKSLTEDLKALGYEMSALDPCIMKLYDRTRKRLLGGHRHRSGRPVHGRGTKNTTTEWSS